MNSQLSETPASSSEASSNERQPTRPSERAARDPFDFTHPVSAEEQERIDRVGGRRQARKRFLKTIGSCTKETWSADGAARPCVLPNDHKGFCFGGRECE